MPKMTKQQKNITLIVVLVLLGGYYFYTRKKGSVVTPPIKPPVPPNTSDVGISDTYIVNTMSTSLNIREKPDAASKVVGTLMKGSKFLGQRSENPSWIKVFSVYPVVRGYVSSQYVKLFIATNPTTGGMPSVGGSPSTGGVVQGQPSASIKMKVRVKTSGGNLNVRESNSTSSKIIGQLKNNEVVEAKGILGAGPWEKIVMSSGKEGYVSTAFIVYL